MAPRLLGNSRNVGDEVARAICVGVAASIIDITALTVLVSVLAWNYLPANVASFTIGTAFNYAFSIAWVFPHRSLANRWSEATLFACAGMLGLFVSQAAMFVSVEWAGLHFLMAKFVAMGSCFAFNFSSRKLLLFREAPKELL